MRVVVRAYFSALAGICGILAAAAILGVLIGIGRFAQEPEDLFAAAFSLGSVCLLGALAILGVVRLAPHHPHRLRWWGYLLAAAVVALGVGLLLLARNDGHDSGLVRAFGIQCFFATLLVLLVPQHRESAT